ncbi:testis-expressed protein 264 homolog [Babylonia areolata]|uniref:testis-expressed protein 264 homolog n=1 Tax=Babylonia areolata TaxID=304850 RepID=UPI003FD6BFEC
MDTWLILVAICVLFFCLIVTVSVLIFYSGVFENIVVKAGKPPIGKVVIAYKFARGSYKEVGPLFFEVAKLAPDHKALGIYYDDPFKVESYRQRYAVACILAEDEQEVDRDLVKKFEAEGFKMMDLPLADHAVHSSFPYKCALSIFIGVQRIYPRMSEYIKEHGLQAHPFVEIYSGNTIHYMSPLDKQETFYVPESLQQFPGEEPYESVYSSEPSPDSSEGDSQSQPEAESLLHPSQIVRAEVIGKVEEEPEKSAVEEMEDEGEKKTAEEADIREDSPDPEPSSIPGGEAQKERGSDEESGSSFEDLKLEAEEVSAKAHSL